MVEHERSALQRKDSVLGGVGSGSPEVLGSGSQGHQTVRSGSSSHSAAPGSEEVGSGSQVHRKARSGWSSHSAAPGSEEVESGSQVHRKVRSGQLAQSTPPGSEEVGSGFGSVRPMEFQGRRLGLERVAESGSSLGSGGEPEPGSELASGLASGVEAWERSRRGMFLEAWSLIDLHSRCFSHLRKYHQLHSNQQSSQFPEVQKTEIRKRIQTFESGRADTLAEGGRSGSGTKLGFRSQAIPECSQVGAGPDSGIRDRIPKNVPEGESSPAGAGTGSSAEPFPAGETEGYLDSDQGFQPAGRGWVVRRIAESSLLR